MDYNIKELILKFLSSAYPIKRVQSSGQRIRYQKSILIYGKYYALSIDTEKNKIIENLKDIIKRVFGFIPNDIQNIVETHIKH